MTCLAAARSVRTFPKALQSLLSRDRSAVSESELFSFGTHGSGSSQRPKAGWQDLTLSPNYRSGDRRLRTYTHMYRHTSLIHSMATYSNLLHTPPVPTISLSKCEGLRCPPHYRLHPRYLLTESPTDLTEAYWACQSGGAPNVDPETGFPYPEFPTKGTVFDPERHRR